jgi:hypothetical protein
MALNHLDQVTAVYLDTGAIWENYSPMRVARGDGALRDLVGFSGLAPINLLLEYAIGLRADAPSQTLTWIIRTDQRVGCERYRFGNIVVSLVCDGPDGDGCRTLRVSSDHNFHLRILLNDRPYGFEVTANAPLRVSLPASPRIGATTRNVDKDQSACTSRDA